MKAALQTPLPESDTESDSEYDYVVSKRRKSKRKSTKRKSTRKKSSRRKSTRKKSSKRKSKRSYRGLDVDSVDFTNLIK